MDKRNNMSDNKSERYRVPFSFCDEISLDDLADKEEDEKREEAHREGRQEKQLTLDLSFRENFRCKLYDYYSVLSSRFGNSANDIDRQLFLNGVANTVDFLRLEATLLETKGALYFQ